MSINSWFAFVYRSQRAVISESTFGVGFLTTKFHEVFALENDIHYPVVAKLTHIRTILRRTVKAMFPGRIGIGHDETSNK
jgi:hypothetical protein